MLAAMTDAVSPLEVTCQGDELRLRLTAAVVDSGLSAALQRGFDAAVRTRPREARRCRVDVSRVSAMSSSGFEALLLLHGACRDAGLPLVFSKPTAEFQQLLSRMGFLRLLRVEGVNV